MKNTLRWIVFCVVVVGCSSQLARRDYDPIPVEADGIRVILRQAVRGEKGGMFTVEVSNHGAGSIEVGAAGKSAMLRTEDGSVRRALSGGEFKRMVEDHGPVAMGLKKAGNFDLPTFDRESEVAQEESAWFQVPFELPAECHIVNLELTDVIRRRGPDGNIRPIPEGISMAIALPDVPPPGTLKKMKTSLSGDKDK